VKNRAGDHEVPLSDAAIAVLKEARAAYEATGFMSGYVFPSDIGDTPISGWSKVKPKIDRAVQGEMAGLTKAEKRAVSARGALRSETVERKAEALEKIAQAEAITWRIHDLRHTFITRVRDGEENAEGEIVYSAPLDVLQAVVNHEITAGVTGHYDHGDIQRRYRLRKREVLDWWARKLMRIVGEADADENVVAFAKCA
jgi:integrase